MQLRPVKFFLFYLLQAAILQAAILQAFAAQGGTRIDSLIRAQEGMPDDTIKIDLQKAIAEELYFRDPRLAVRYASDAYRLSTAQRDTARMIESLSLMGAAYQMTPDFPKSLQAYFTALRLAEQAGHADDIAGLYSDIGACYIYTKQFEASYSYLAKAIALQLRTGKKELATTYNNIGLLFSEKGEYEKSIRYYKKALQIDSALGKEEEKGCTLINIAEVYRKLNDIGKASAYYREALPLCRHNPYYTTACYIDLGLIENTTGNYTEALAWLKKAETLSKASGLYLFMARIYGTMARVYENRNDFVSALRYNKLFHQTKDSTYNVDVARQINEVRAIYEAEKKDEQIELLTLEKRRADEEQSRNVLIRNLFIAVSLLVFAACFILARNIVLKQRLNRFLQQSNRELSLKNSELNEKNDQIETQKKQIEHVNQQLKNFNSELKKDNMAARYEVLQSKVNPHFLFNSLTTLSTIVAEDPGLAQEYIDTFSQLYRLILHHSDKDILSLHEEYKITSCYLYLQKMKFGDNVDIDFDESIGHVKGGLPPLSLQMVIENIFKHNKISKQYPLKIRISYEQDKVIVYNNLQKRPGTHLSSRTGIINIKERYRLLTDAVQPGFRETASSYIAVLPVLQLSKHGVSV